MIAEDIHKEAEDVLRNLGPKVSNDQYEKGFDKFWEWRTKRGVDENELPNEDQIIVFIKNRQELYNYKPSSIKPMISMLKSQILKRFGFDISNYHKLKLYVKELSEGYETTKAEVFSEAEWAKFITEAPDREHLLHKVCCFV